MYEEIGYSPEQVTITSTLLPSYSSVGLTDEQTASDDDIFETIVDQSEITGLSPLYEFQLGQTVDVKATKEQAKIVNIADHVIDPYQIQIGDLTQQVSPFHIRPYIA